LAEQKQQQGETNLSPRKSTDPNGEPVAVAKQLSSSSDGEEQCEFKQGGNQPVRRTSTEKNKIKEQRKREKQLASEYSKKSSEKWEEAKDKDQTYDKRVKAAAHSAADKAGEGYHSAQSGALKHKDKTLEAKERDAIAKKEKIMREEELAREYRVRSHEKWEEATNKEEKLEKRVMATAQAAADKVTEGFHSLKKDVLLSKHEKKIKETEKEIAQEERKEEKR